MAHSSQDNPAPQDILTGDALSGIGRATVDLRRGLPIVIDEGEAGMLVLSTEFLTTLQIEAMQAVDPKNTLFVLTTQRAETLKIRPYTDEIVLIPLNDLGEDQKKAPLLQSLADPTLDLANPLRGPFTPLRDVDQALLRLARLAVRQAKIALLLPSVLCCPLIPGPGQNARDWALERNLTPVSADALDNYDTLVGKSLKAIISAKVPLEHAPNTRITSFRPDDGSLEHFALVVGEPNPREPVLIRIHSECFTGDLLGSLKCDCGDQLKGAIREIGELGHGILIYLAQEGRGIGLMNKLRAYQLQDQGFDTNEANERVGFRVDERHFLPAAEILRKLGFSKVRLMTNNPLKVEALAQFGIEIVERVEHKFIANEHNEFYLRTKAEKSGHYL